MHSQRSSGVPWNPRGLAVEAPVASSRRRYITKALIQQHGETPGRSACLRIASQHTAKCRERFERLINPSAADSQGVQRRINSLMAVQHQWSSCSRRHTPPWDSLCGQLQARSEAWRTVRRLRQQRGLTHTPPPPALPHQVPPQPEVEMSAVPVPDDAMEVNALCEERVSQPDLEAFFRQGWRVL